MVVARVEEEDLKSGEAIDEIATALSILHPLSSDTQKNTKNERGETESREWRDMERGEQSADRTGEKKGDVLSARDRRLVVALISCSMEVARGAKR
jgi:hypothetical protein